MCYRATGRDLHGRLKTIFQSDFFNLALKAVKVGANFTSDDSLFQSGIVIIQKDFENGIILVLMVLKFCVLPHVLLSGLHSINREGYLSINCFVEHIKPSYFVAFLQAVPTKAVNQLGRVHIPSCNY